MKEENGKVNLCVCVGGNSTSPKTTEREKRTK